MSAGRIVIVGAGKVGRSLHRAAITAGLDATLERARSVSRRAAALRNRSPRLVILALRDDAIPQVAISVAGALGAPGRSTSIVHTSGRFGPEILDGARALGAATGQMHPLVSFVGRVFAPLEGATMLVAGDARALRAARGFAKAIGMVARRFDDLPRPLYHAAAALVANSAAALAEAALELLGTAGVPRKTAAAMVGPLLASVANNVTAVGLPEALSGPVRRGDVTAVAGHLDALRRALKRRQSLEWIEDLYRAGVLAQLPIASSLGEASRGGLAAIHALVAHTQPHARHSALRSRKR
jgi:predicted short-subunit dehydrogenase-like oxidoreductase (DUF2520 family)